MARTVTIPESYKPLYTVWVNGVKYEYPAGETVEVPDGVADVIENDYALDPKEDPDATNAPSYNSLADKPFYEETITLNDTLTWDGNTDGLICADDTFYKVSDIVLTASDVSNGVSLVSSINDIDSTIDLPAEAVQSAFSPSDGFAIIADKVIVVPYDGWDKLDFAFPKAGIYFLNYGGTTRVKSFTVNGYKGFESTQTVVHPIDRKYLPESLQFGSGHKEEVTIECYDDEETTLDGFPEFTTGDLVKIKVDGVEYSLEAYTNEYGLPSAGDPMFGNVGERKHGWGLTVYVGESVTFMGMDGKTHYVSYDAEVVHTIDKKYLPKMDYIPELDSAPTANDFNRLLSYLCEAGYMKNE